MRFRSLGLDAFGPFADQRIDLSGGAPGGLHVIFGPNEAGKSTSLRAVSALLYGIPHRTRDAHLHASKSLRLSAELERDGEVLRIQRLKRRKDSLVDEKGEPMPEEALLPWLRGLDQRSFETRFGLDQDELERGAEALLGGSEQGLFAAGTAGADVRELLKGLEDETSALFLPRGRNPKLNAALAALGDASREARLAVRPPEKWREQKRAYDLAVAEVESLSEKRRQLRTEHARLSRLASVASDVSRWVDASKERKALGNVPELPADATERRLEAQRDLREAELERARWARDLVELERRLQELPGRASLLEIDDERLTLLRNKIGWELKAKEDRPKLEGKLQSREEEARRVVQRMGRLDGFEQATAEELEQLLIEAAAEKRTRRLMTEFGKLEAARDQAVAALAQTERELARAKQALAASATAMPLDDIEAVLGDARSTLAKTARSGELVRRYATREARKRRLRDELGIDFEHGVELPETASLERLRDDYTRLVRQLEEAESHHVALKRRQLELEASVASFRAEGDIPTEEDLRRARDARDGAHRELLAAIAERLDSMRLAACAEEVRLSIERADLAVDRLRREAHRVSELASLESTLETVLRESGVALERAKSVRMDLASWEEAWQGLWIRSFVRAPSPHEASAKLRRLEEWNDVVEQAAAERLELERLDGEETRARERLKSVLERAAPSGSPAGLAELGLAGLIDVAERAVRGAARAAEQHQGLALRITGLGERLDEQRAVLERCEVAIGAWRRNWAQTMKSLGLSEQASLEEAEAMLEELGELARILDDARDKRRRIAGIERDSREFAEQVRVLLEQHAAYLLGRPAADAAESLLVRARECRQVERDRAGLQSDVEKCRTRLKQAETAITVSQARLQELAAAAGLDHIEGLAAVEEASRRARALESEIATLAQALRSKAGGASLNELVEEVRIHHHDDALSRIDDLSDQIDQTEEELRVTEQKAQGLELGLDTYRSEDAALASQRVAARTAEARAALRDYLVARTAETLLKREMARYAERFQGPILQLAGEHFRRLTLDNYEGLRVGLGENRLRCVRRGADIDVDELSRGTRAQLYLALRLASLENHFANHAPVPLVFDDLFVDFDDDRACAAFEILGELANRVQILYFTHLGRDLHAARDAVAASRLFEHTIGVQGAHLAEAL